jgi:hypothetical protein
MNGHEKAQKSQKKRNREKISDGRLQTVARSVGFPFVLFCAFLRLFRAPAIPLHRSSQAPQNG